MLPLVPCTAPERVLVAVLIHANFLSLCGHYQWSHLFGTQNPVLPCKNNKTDITYYISTCHYHTVPLVSFHQTAADHISFVDSSISHVGNYSREL